VALADFKPAITTEQVAELLRAELGTAVRDLRLLKGGELSRAYGFGTGEGEFVVRFNANEVGFRRDRYASEHFASPELPIPRILAIGQAEGTAFALSEFVRGEHLHMRSPGEYLRLLPRALDVLDALHRIDAGDAVGLGYWQEPGRGQFPTWRRYLAAVIEEEPAGFFAGWHRLFNESFLERDLYEATHRRMLELAAACPEERWILHGDFGFDNVLADRERITGVLDWSDLAYGDFVYDLARIDLFSANPAVTELLRGRYAAATPNYAERLACYQCWISLNGLRFYALAGNRAAYGWAKQRLAESLALVGG
jgi:hygromycin-B 4-O-kinase